MATNTFTLIHLIDLKCVTQWEVIVAELVEWLLPTPEDTGLNPVIGNFISTFVYC